MCNNLDERENTIGLILDHKDNKGRDEHEIHEIAKKINRWSQNALSKELRRLNKKAYC